VLEVFIEHAFRMERLVKGAPHLAQIPRSLLPRPVPL
jgi:hypothetical protein